MKRILLLLIVIGLCLNGCKNEPEIVEEPEIIEVDHTNDAALFKEEYEALNKKTNEYTLHKYPAVTINETNPAYYASIDEIINLIKADTGIIYMGTPDNIWCRDILPVLLEALEEQSFDTLYYLNMETIRDEKTIDDDGVIVTTKEAEEGYYELLELLNDYTPQYAGLNDASIRRIYLPTVIAIKNGEVVLYWEGTLPTHHDPYVPLTEAQHEVLKSIYVSAIKELQKTEE